MFDGFGHWRFGLAKSWVLIFLEAEPFSSSAIGFIKNLQRFWISGSCGLQGFETKVWGLRSKVLGLGVQIYQTRKGLGDR